MKLPLWAEKILWALLPAGLALLLGAGPLPFALAAQMRAVGQALEAGDAVTALPLLEEITTRLPWRSSLYDLTGQTALAAGEPLAAIEYLTQAAEAGRISLDGQVRLGQAYRQAGDLPAAVLAWKGALQSPEAGDSTFRMEIYQMELEAYQELNDLAGQIEVLREITRLNPADAESRYVLGLLLAAEEPQAALATLLEALELDESLEETVRILEENLSDPAAGVEGGDEEALTFMNAGRALALIGRWDLAARAFERVTQLEPEYPDGWAFLGEARSQAAGDPGETGIPTAWEAIQLALALDPASLSANLFAGLYWKRVGYTTPREAEKALPYFAAADQLDPNNPAIQVEIGSVYDLLGDTALALEGYQRAASLAPGEPAYWHLLAQYSLEANVQVEAVGLAAARQAFFLNEEDPTALDLMGYGYYLLDDMLLARRFLDQATAANPGYAPAHLHLALVAIAGGDMDEARRQLELVFELAPGSAAAGQAQKIWEQMFP